MPFETLNVRIPHKQERDLWRQAVQLQVTPSHLVRCLLAAGAARFQPAELGPTGAVLERCPKCGTAPDVARRPDGVVRLEGPHDHRPVQEDDGLPF